MLSRRQAAIASCTVILTSSLLSQTFHGTVPVTSYPQAIAVNPFTDKIYTIDEPANMDKTLTHFASEKSLTKDWLTPEEDKAWRDL